MKNELARAYAELAIRQTDLPEDVMHRALASVRTLFEEVSEDELMERMKKLWHGVW